MKPLPSFLRHPLLQAMLLAPAFVLTGCVGVLPIPDFSNRPINGTRLRGRDAAFIRPGTTSASEVFAALGTDCLWDPRQRAVAFSWELPGGQGIWWVVTTEAGAGGDFEWTRWRALFVAFDTNNVVVAAKTKHLSSRKTLDEHLNAWGRKHHAAPGHMHPERFVAKNPSNRTNIPPGATAAARREQ
jgi:hypothetical protein